MTNARLFFWGARSLYLGPTLGLSPHRNAVAVLCAGLDTPFEVAVSARLPEAGYEPYRTLLIPPNTLHHLRANGACMAFLYLDAQSSDYDRLRASEARPGPGPTSGLAGEDAYLTALRRLRDGTAWRDAQLEIAAALGLAVPERLDQRVAKAIRRLSDDPAGKHPLAELAARAGLSSSRFLHVFKGATGVPLRRYRLWSRMGAAVRGMAQGLSLTEAALGAGFANSAHFSAAFREMFGMPPSGLVQASLRIEESATGAPAVARQRPEQE
ncbi:transcriptional regulator, AraC family [Rhizobiales bacterium GAS113]|jgi:AraC-like DNA-binding protein|nr:transcriptional regulator, AraC family [Rhizobiales bacterium GAS113]SEB87621.1 transcriptional regulator, AraC family [Rhizobiales bacterium GAS188]